MQMADSKTETTGYQPRGPTDPSGAPPNRGTSVAKPRIPISRFRWKGTRLQQAYVEPNISDRCYWVDILTVSGDAPDVEVCN
jgi:hypothetical protein